MIGQQILNYRIEKMLGEGGMGSVYLASHTQLERKAAIKVLHPNLATNPQIRERFKNEASTMAHLKHPNIVDLYDYMETPNGLFLIMEFISGKELEDYIKTVSGPVPEEHIIHFFSQILDGFNYAHKEGVVHRDIKPSNLLITPKGKVKILDFGIAKLMDSADKNMTKAGARMGTVLYMSPEQVKGEAVDRRSDIYALGVTLFQMATGRGPYIESQVTEYEVYSKIVNEPLPRAKSVYPNVSDKLQAIIDKATAKNPAQRFQTCEDFKNAILSLQSPEEDLHNSQYGQTQTNLKTTPAEARPISESERINQEIEAKRRRRRQNYWIRTSIFTLFFLFILYAVFFNPFHLSFLKPVAVFEANTPEDLEEIAKNRIKEYYQAIESHQIDKVIPFFAENIELYLYERNKNVNPDFVKHAYEYYWFSEKGPKVQAEKSKIDWDSWQYEHIEANEEEEIEEKFIISLKMNYSYRTPKEKENINITQEIIFNKDWKIVSVKTL